jgi:cell division transport system permease protein
MRPFYFREAWRSFGHHRGLATTAIVALTASLLVAGVFLLLAHNARIAMRLVAERGEMIVYLKDDVSREHRDAMITRLRQLYGDVQYVSKEQAWQDFNEQIGDPELLESVDGNPLPASLRIRLRAELLSYPAMKETARQLSQFPEVEDVRYGGEWAKRLDDTRQGLENGAIAIGIVVAIAMVFILYNTIRLTVLARRHQVEIMSRLGASDRFIATPFVIEALLQAVIAAVLALAAVFGFQQAFSNRVVPIVFLPWAWVGIYCAVVLGLAWIAAMLALSRVLRSVGA